ncbi:MAG: hypothetical protein II514_04565 [Ruminococcus sp.]|nr:hypothetical protein [Ruminococcus sp.]
MDMPDMSAAAESFLDGIGEAEAPAVENGTAGTETADRSEDSAQTGSHHEHSIKDEVAEFAAAFPDVFERAHSDPRTIPQSVWNAVNAGKTLTEAYTDFKTGAFEKANAARSTGSMKSAGGRHMPDAFEAGLG